MYKFKCKHYSSDGSLYEIKKCFFMRTLALVFKFRFVFEQLVREKINREKLNPVSASSTEKYFTDKI